MPTSTIYNAMVAENLAVVSLLADSGNGEVLNPLTDLPKVNGQNDPVSTSNRLVHWDAEWHWDTTYFQYPHQALGGHVLTLGLTNAYQIWREYTYPIFNMAHQQGGIAGFAHMQFLPLDSFPTTLDCCTPFEYPVEVALGACDFISEDIAGSDSAMLAYYRLLNCGFRPGWAGGSDYPCSANIGDIITYVQIPGGQLTYSNWIHGIAQGRTVVSRTGHTEFLDLKANTNAIPGDTVALPAGGGTVQVSVQWSATTSQSGSLEIVRNGEVVTNRTASVSVGNPTTLTATLSFTNSGWIVARRMSGGEHQSHTAAIFVEVGGQPIRASVADALFYVDWMDELLTRTAVNGAWASYFITNRAEAHARYQAARDLYQQIANEAAALEPVVILTQSLPDGFVNQAFSTALTASGGLTPYKWSIISGALPTGLTLNTNTGSITGTPTTVGSSSLNVRVEDSGNPARTATQAFSLAVSSLPPLNAFGNTNSGTLTDYISDVDAWINAGRFQASSNVTVSAIRARLVGGVGRYKCARKGGRRFRWFRRRR